jgi:hypothetical protein
MFGLDRTVQKRAESLRVPLPNLSPLAVQHCTLILQNLTCPSYIDEGESKAWKSGPNTDFVAPIWELPKSSLPRELAFVTFVGGLCKGLCRD